MGEGGVGMVVAKTEVWIWIGFDYVGLPCFLLVAACFLHFREISFGVIA